MSSLEAVHQALQSRGDKFANVILDDEAEDILLTFVHDSTDYIITVKEAT